MARAGNGDDEGKVDDTIKGIVSAATGLVDGAANLVPESVPRPAAKTGVAVAGVLITFWLLQKVISGVITLALLGGVGYYFLTKSGNAAAEKRASSREVDDMDDPLSEAKKIMEKYK